jgi:hypothetical protein
MQDPGRNSDLSVPHHMVNILDANLRSLNVENNEKKEG